MPPVPVPASPAACALVQQFTHWVQHERPTKKRVGASTAERYARLATDFTRRLGHPAHVDAETLRAWFDGLLHAGEAPATVNLKLAAARAFCHFALDKRMRSDDPTLGLRMQDKASRLPQPVEEAEYERLVTALREAATSDPWAVQDLAIVEVLFGSGVRRAEAARLTVGAVQFDGADTFLQVLAKGDQSHVTLLPRASYLALCAWVVQHYTSPALQALTEATGTPEAAFRLLHATAPETPLWVTQAGRAVRDLKDPGHYLWHRFQQVAERLDLRTVEQARATPHKLRHTFATSLINNGASLDEVQDVMNHKDSRTTRTYAKRDRRGLKRILAKHPRAGMAL